MRPNLANPSLRGLTTVTGHLTPLLFVLPHSQHNRLLLLTQDHVLLNWYTIVFEVHLNSGNLPTYVFAASICFEWKICDHYIQRKQLIYKSFTRGLLISFKYYQYSIKFNHLELNFYTCIVFYAFGKANVIDKKTASICFRHLWFLWENSFISYLMRNIYASKAS